MKTRFQTPRSQRSQVTTHAGRFRGGKLVPISAVPFRTSESGVVNQTIDFELDPIAGKMITNMTTEIHTVFVPIEAIDALKNPEEDFSGSKESIRQKLLSGAVLFDMEQEGELTKRMGVVPKSVNGQKNVCEVVRLAHNSAVNYLRRRVYSKATQISAANTQVTNAILSETILNRLNAVLDPEDRIDGSVDLSFGDVQLPVDGIGVGGGYTPDFNTPANFNESDGGHDTYTNYGRTSSGQDILVKMSGAANARPQIFAQLTAANAGNISLSDFGKAQQMDELTRIMRKIVDDNPEYGEEMVARFAHGLNIETNKQPYMLYSKSNVLNMGQRYATDGPSLDQSQTESGGTYNYSVIVPKTEFGGILVTFAVLKPDETLADQPHPILSEPWGVTNFAADELKQDPQPVTARQLDAEVASADEGTVMLYTGHNELLRQYQQYGFTRNTDLTTVANQIALWQYEAPASVTPENILYPFDIEHYPFLDQAAEVCAYTVTTSATISTPMIYGPTPVETLTSLDTENIFEDE